MSAIRLWSDLGKTLLEDLDPVRPEHVRRKELDDLLARLVLAQVDHARVVLGHEPRVSAVDLARVVRGVAAAPHLAVHPQSAQRALEERPQDVSVFAVVIVTLCRLSHVVALDRGGIGPIEHLTRHERLVCGLL
ncbi:MAG: hypothetical protein M3454_17560 [Actinomycetota bacterium]|nr:hypothetical protein [Actinomycetota bacterium]